MPDNFHNTNNNSTKKYGKKQKKLEKTQLQNFMFFHDVVLFILKRIASKI